MKKIAMFLLLLLLTIGLASCQSNEGEEQRNKEIFAIYTMAVSAGSVNQTYEEWLETIKGENGDQGPQGEQGISGVDGEEVLLSVNGTHVLWKYESDSEWEVLIALIDLIGPSGFDGMNIEIRYDTDFLQWKYESETTWTNLFSIDLLIGDSGEDGRQVLLRAEGNTLQWKYEDEDTWVDLITLNSTDKYYLQDDEINSLLTSYDDDMNDIFPQIDLSTLDSDSYTNDCITVDFEDCNNINNYPTIFGEGYERYEEKQESVKFLSDIMSVISDLMGSYESEPIVPTQHLSGSDAFATVTGRNTTSVLFEGEIDGSIPIPIDLPVDVEFTYNLLIYKSVEDSKIYVEGEIDITGGIAFIDVSTFKTSFLSTYSFDYALESFVYTTDIIGFSEWVTVMQPTNTGTEIYSTNMNSIEYYSRENTTLNILYSSNWYEDNNDYIYELYDNNDLVYILENYDDQTEYHIPLSDFSGWDKVEYTEDSVMFSDNEFEYSISLNDTIIQEGMILETPLETEVAWIMLSDFNHYFNDLGNLEKESAGSVIYLMTYTKYDMISFMDSNLTYGSSASWEEYNAVVDKIGSYSYFSYSQGDENTSGVFDKFNLR